MEEKTKDMLIKEYEIAISMQMHFNDMLTKYRSLAFTVISGLFALLIISQESKMIDVELAGNIINLGWITAIITIVWLLVALLDVSYYFQLLLATVDRTNAIEKLLKVGKTELSTPQITQCLNKQVSRGWANILVCFFYFIPLLAGIVLTYLFLTV